MDMTLADHFPERLWAIQHPEQLLSPQLVVFREHLLHNLNAMLQLAGPHALTRLRPHCKTHKMPAITKLQLELGITKHKAATLAECEMLATAGVRDIVLAYNLVGPNIARAVRFRQQFPNVNFMVTADAVKPLEQLSAAMHAAGQSIGVLLDINPGRDRTGLPAGEEARSLYQLMARLPNLTPAGFHIYDGHFLHSDLQARTAAVKPEWDRVRQLRDQLESAGLPVPRLICGGTPTFPVFAQFDDPALELSPGTCVFHDVSYHERFPDLRAFRPAALVFTRVVSRPANDRVTFDVGTKAIASDPPIGQRAYLPALPDGEQVIHNEEHLVVKTSLASRFQPGDWALAIPRHVCPTSALYREAIVIEAEEIVDSWPVIARDRKLTL